MTIYGFDAAYQPDLAAVKAAGGVAVNGYLTGRYATTTSTPAHALAVGLGWWATYEEGPGELVNASRATGRAVAGKILAAFRALRDNNGNALPLDGSLAVYPSVDQSVLDPTACDQAWMGLRDILAGQLSVRYYGQGSIGDHLHRQGLLDGPYWLAAPTSWPGYQPNDPAVCIVQEVGTNVPGTDRNHILTQPEAIGALWPAGSIYAGGGMTPQEIAQAVLDAKDSPDTGTVRQTIHDARQIARRAEVAADQALSALTSLSAAVAKLQQSVDALNPAPGTAGSDVTKGVQ